MWADLDRRSHGVAGIRSATHDLRPPRLHAPNLIARWPHQERADLGGDPFGAPLGHDDRDVDLAFGGQDLDRVTRGVHLARYGLERADGDERRERKASRSLLP